MITNIKNLWGVMLPETRKKALQTIIEDNSYDATDLSYIKNQWIYQKNIPHKYQEKIVKLFQNSIVQQSQRSELLISNTQI